MRGLLVRVGVLAAVAVAALSWLAVGRDDETGRLSSTGPAAAPSEGGLRQQDGETQVADKKAEKGDDKPHPLDPALKVARDGLQHMHQDIRDYTATIVKRERINGRLTDHEFLFAKVRSRKVSDGKVVVPPAVYLKFLKPPSVAGREVIWVEDRNDGKLIAHEGGFKNLLTVRLEPSGFVAMLGQRYPITEIGMENLIEQLIAKGEKDRQHGECEVQFFKSAKVNDRVCTMIQVTHPRPRPYFDYYQAQIYIDDELNVPIRYAAWSWPETDGGEPVLEEEYTYLNVKLNVDLTDKDFDAGNPEYAFR